MTDSNAALFQSNVDSLSLVNRGKVRDIYDVDDDHLLIVTSDRISAFDVVLPDPIPGKGSVLTTVSNFWFARTQNLIGNHLTGRSLESAGLREDEVELLDSRAIIVKKLAPLPVYHRFRLEGLPA